MAQSASLKAERPAPTSDHIFSNNKAETIQAKPANLKEIVKSNSRSGEKLLSASTKLRSEKAK